MIVQAGVCSVVVLPPIQGASARTIKAGDARPFMRGITFDELTVFNLHGRGRGAVRHTRVRANRGSIMRHFTVFVQTCTRAVLCSIHEV